MRPRHWSAVALALVIPCCVATGAGAQSLIEHYTAGLQARAAGNFDVYRSEFEAAEQLERGHAVLEFHLARACAQTEDPAAALDWLRKSLLQGAWMDVRTDQWLAPLQGAPGWDATLALADSVGGYHGHGQPGFELQESDLHPEGIEYDPVSQRFLLGSLKRKILWVDHDGNCTEFVAPAADGVLAVLGLRVDPVRRRLWAVSLGDDNLTPLTTEETGATRLHCWSLEDGSLLGRWDAPTDSLRHGFNDVALLPDGSAITTDGFAGALYGVAIGDEALHEVVAAGGLRGPNGLVVRDDGAHAWVSEYVYGVAFVDLETGATEQLKVPADIALIGVDGLYYREGELIAVQNYAGLNRAAAFRLSPDGKAVTAVRVLEAHHPRVSDPTTGVIVDGEFWYIVNSNIAGYDRHDDEDPAALGTVLIQRVGL